MPEVDFDWTHFERLHRDLPEVAAKESIKGLGQFLGKFERKMKTERMSKNWRHPDRPGVATRSGALKATMITQIPDKPGATRLDDIAGIARVGGGPASAYARIQEEGGVVRMRSKKLTVPVEWPPGSGNWPALTKGGQPRFSSARDADLEVFIHYRHPSGKTSLFPVGGSDRSTEQRPLRASSGRRGGGKVINVYLGRRGRSGPEMFYVLKESVRLKPRLGFMDTYYAHWASEGIKTLHQISRRIHNRLEGSA